jgi:HlyD family type I secretion membrane fusion protein
MNQTVILDLADCTEFRQTVEARPPRIVHGTVWLLAGLLAASVAWAALTRADLVVRSKGTVRPTRGTQKVVNPGRSDVLTGSAGAPVKRVLVKEGDLVKQGDVLIEFEATRLESEIAKQQKVIEVAEGALQKGERLRELLTNQYTSAKGSAQAQLKAAEAAVAKAKDKQKIEVSDLEDQVTVLKDKEARSRRALNHGAGSPEEYNGILGQLKDAKAKLATAQLPVDEGQLEKLRHDLVKTEKDYNVDIGKLEAEQLAKQGDIDKARAELKQLNQQREQAFLRAPMDGVVTTVATGDVKVGDVLEPGKPVMEIAERKGFRFEVMVKSEEVGRLEVGMPARIKLDPFDYQRYGTVQGKVHSISTDSRTVEGQPATYYLVKIDLESEEVGRGEYHGQVKLGMSGEVDIVTGQETLLSLLVKKIRQSISLG